jgi:hypothetical protein
MRVRLAGYVHLARMVDKCRAVLAGTLGEYIYPCPLDERLLEFAGLRADQFTEAVKSHGTDEAMAQWFRQHAAAHTPAELETWNHMMLNRGPSTPEKQMSFNKYRDAIDPSRTDLTSWADLQDLEEGRPVPRRA